MKKFQDSFLELKRTILFFWMGYFMIFPDGKWIETHNATEWRPAALCGFLKTVYSAFCPVCSSGVFSVSFS